MRTVTKLTCYSPAIEEHLQFRIPFQPCFWSYQVFSLVYVHYSRLRPLLHFNKRIPHLSLSLIPIPLGCLIGSFQCLFNWRIFCLLIGLCISCILQAYPMLSLLWKYSHNTVSLFNITCANLNVYEFSYQVPQPTLLRA